MHDGAVVSLMHRDGDDQSWCGVVLVLFFFRWPSFCVGKHSGFLCCHRFNTLL
jgi:hypothetical protein